MPTTRNRYWVNPFESLKFATAPFCFRFVANFRISNVLSPTESYIQLNRWFHRKIVGKIHCLFSSSSSRANSAHFFLYSFSNWPNTFCADSFWWWHFNEIKWLILKSIENTRRQPNDAMTHRQKYNISKVRIEMRRIEITLLFILVTDNRSIVNTRSRRFGQGIQFTRLRYSGW